MYHRNVYSFDDRLLNLKNTKLVDKDAREKQSSSSQKKIFTTRFLTLSKTAVRKKDPPFWKQLTKSSLKKL